MSPHAVNHVIRRALAAALCALALPAAAQADVSVDRGRLAYTAGPDANHVVVTAAGSTVTVTDSAPLPAGPGCKAGAAGAVTCTGVSSLRLQAGDGDNFVDARGAALPTTVITGSGADRVYTGAGVDSLTTGGGADWLDAGAGADLFSAGAGDDVVIARDGVRDGVGCGSGHDVGTDDNTDFTAPDCEALGDTPPSDAAAPPSGDGGGTGDGGTSDGTGSGDSSGEPAGTTDGSSGSTDAGSDPDGPPVGNPLTGPLNLEPPVVLATSAPVARGVATIAIGCPADSGGCEGAVDLFLVKAKKKRGGVSAAAARRIGHAKFKAKPGAKPRVKVRLDRRGRRRVIRRRKLPVRVVVTTKTATGQVVKTARRITLSRR